MVNQTKMDSTSCKSKFTLPERFLATLSNVEKLGVAMAPTNVASTGIDSPNEGIDQPAVELAHLVENAQPSDLRTDGNASPEVHMVPLTAVTNADFVAAIFGTLPDRVSAVVCSKIGDPTNGGWPAMKAGQVNQQCLVGWNNYTNCSSFREDTLGTIHARKDSFFALHFILLDDMGTKWQWEQLDDFKPSFVVETSPGNFQAGIILSEPLIDIGIATQLVEAVIAKGLSDPGATGVARWARQPGGINGKSKYKSEAGKPFQCRLAHWNPERRYSVEEIVTGLNLELTPHLSKVGDSSKTTVTPPAREIDPAAVARLPQLLDAIAPDCERPEWVRVLSLS